MSKVLLSPAHWMGKETEALQSLKYLTVAVETQRAWWDSQWLLKNSLEQNTEEEISASQMFTNKDKGSLWTAHSVLIVTLESSIAVSLPNREVK